MIEVVLNVEYGGFHLDDEMVDYLCKISSSVKSLARLSPLIWAWAKICLVRVGPIP